jgi:transcriptional regulator of met regulon
MVFSLRREIVFLLKRYRGPCCEHGRKYKINNKTTVSFEAFLIVKILDDYQNLFL